MTKNPITAKIADFAASEVPKTFVIAKIVECVFQCLHLRTMIAKKGGISLHAPYARRISFLPVQSVMVCSVDMRYIGTVFKISLNLTPVVPYVKKHPIPSKI